ncbi:MAG: 3-deoxy-8-phosphooctulonate synthase [candidate division Zixibacteria bacterium]|nr:3-deoxy-8-phosphooctulonate synthase [candidate division Zixibacteria bacterium]MBU1472053.1 3-deoxy-8-phosphooctulonate synthase [candidate division Zixibacteria bacterium]MBU2626361.1 3-deoxy-8-phosphooctulonate synthase [candidate division Zixibacteria bacterium]
MIQVGEITVGGDRPVIIAGPCAVESREVAFETAEKAKQLTAKYNFPFIFKSSYKKANRLSGDSFATIGDREALRILAEVREVYVVPVITDVHSVDEVVTAAEVADILQIPAFLCRQTDLVIAAARTGKPVNIKKGQFMAPEDMGEIAKKATATGNNKVMLTERGTFFGYHNLVVDFRSLIIMKELGYPVIFDSTHSLQLPSGSGIQSGGQPQFVIPFAKAAAAIGIDGLFLEIHPDPSSALCDAASMLHLDHFESYLQAVDQIISRRDANASSDS